MAKKKQSRSRRRDDAFEDACWELKKRWLRVQQMQLADAAMCGMPPPPLVPFNSERKASGKKQVVGGRRREYDDQHLIQLDEWWQQFLAIYREDENKPLRGTRLGSVSHFLQWGDKETLDDFPETAEEVKNLKRAYRYRFLKKQRQKKKR